MQNQAEQRNKTPEPLRADAPNSAHVINREGPANAELQRPHNSTQILHQSPPTDLEDHRQVSDKSIYNMLSLKWENNPIQVTELSTIKVVT